MIKYVFSQLLKFISIITVPGFVFAIVYSFFLGNDLLPLFEDAISSSILSIHEIGVLYFTSSFVLCPLSFILHIVLGNMIYKKHFDDAYNKQLSGRHSRDRHLWDDTNWRKP